MRESALNKFESKISQILYIRFESRCCLPQSVNAFNLKYSQKLNFRKNIQEFEVQFLE